MVGTRSTARPGPAKKPPENERPAPTKNVRFEQAKERFDGVHLKYRPPAKRPTIEKSKHPEKPETTGRNRPYPGIPCPWRPTDLSVMPIFQKNQ